MSVRSVRILWEQTNTEGGGPKKKMWALHRALRRRMEQGLDWLESAFSCGGGFCAGPGS